MERAPFGGTLAEIRANDCDDSVTVPDVVRQAEFPTVVTTRELADGV